MKPLRIEIGIPEFLYRDIEQGVFYCSGSILASRVDRVTGTGIELELADGADPEAITATVRAWVRQSIANALAYEDTTIEEWGVAGGFRATAEEVSASSELKLLGDGLVAYGPRLTRVFRSLVAICEELSDAVGAEPLTLPAVATLDHLHRCDFLRQFPQAVSFVTHFREDFTVINSFGERCLQAEPANACQPAPGDLQPYGKLLRPAVCYHVYPFFENETLDRDPRLVSAMGDCFRYESKNTRGLERLFDFRLFEIVGLGSEATLRAWRQHMTARTVKIFGELELPGRIRASNDPFFASTSVLKSSFQRAHDLKHELQVPFPGREGYLGVASFNTHRDFFGNRYAIRTADGEIASTGCTGFGLDRMLAALLVHHGLDPRGWPAACRKRLDIS